MFRPSSVVFTRHLSKFRSSVDADMTPTSTTTLRNQAGEGILRFDRVFTRDAIFNAPSRVVRSRARFLYDLNPLSRALSSRRSLRASGCAD